MAGDEVGQDLRIRIRSVFDPGLCQFLLKRMIIFNNPVVDDKDFLLLVPMGMGIFFGRLPMGGPAGVCNTCTPGNGQTVDLCLQINNTPRRPVKAYLSSILHRQTGRVIAAVFQPSQALQEDGLCILGPDITNDSTHTRFFLS